MQRLRENGRWSEVLPAVYRLPGVPDTFEGRLEATQLWMGGRGHFAGHTAAYILRLQGIPRPERIEVAMSRGSSRRGLAIKRISPDDMPRLRRVNGFHLPSVERVLLERAASLPPRVVGEALDDALRRGMTSVGRLRSWLDDNGGKGRRGSGVLRELVRGRDELDERTRSRFETEMLRILRQIDGITISPNYPVFVDGERFLVDFYLREPDLGLECHSVKWHGGERSKEDVVRDRRIRSTGMELLYFGWDEVHFEPDGLCEEIRAAVLRRLARRGASRPDRP